MTWTCEHIPDQHGRTFLITGANSGIGKEATRELARRHARVILACRSAAKAEEAMREIRAEIPSADLHFEQLDLASLASVRAAAERIRGQHAIDVLVNNAGIMAIPRQLTADGFEFQLGTNHLGHFALTGLLLPDMLGRHGARVVTVSSIAHRMGAIRFDDLMGARSYGKWSAYSQSKLANLLFHHELQRRLTRRQARVASVACHPGYAATNLQQVGPQQEGSAIGAWGAEMANRLLAQPAAAGAWPTLFAATAPDVAAGDFIGPMGFRNLWGPPGKNTPRSTATDPAVMERLWARSVELTGVDVGGL